MPDDTAPDPVEALIAAWVAWDHTPGWAPAAERKLAAIGQLSLDTCQLHRLVAEQRRAVHINGGTHDRGRSVPDAVQAALLEIRPDLLEDQT